MVQQHHLHLCQKIFLLSSLSQISVMVEEAFVLHTINLKVLFDHSYNIETAIYMFNQSQLRNRFIKITLASW